MRRHRASQFVGVRAFIPVKRAHNCTGVPSWRRGTVHAIATAVTGRSTMKVASTGKKWHELPSTVREDLSRRNAPEAPADARPNRWRALWVGGSHADDRCPFMSLRVPARSPIGTRIRKLQVGVLLQPVPSVTAANISVSSWWHSILGNHRHVEPLSNRFVCPTEKAPLVVFVLGKKPSVVEPPTLVGRSH